MIKFPVEIVRMIKIIEDAGFEAYAVGGCVRDSLLGKHPEDWDLTSNVPREMIRVIFPDAAIVNRKLGVIRITEGEVTADIAAFRIDGEYRDYRRPETVIFTQDIKEDLKRRDFTMNAIAVNPERGVVDPYNGRRDIERKLIRGIGDPGLRFEEDALRILRGLRFAAQLGFQIDSSTLQAMKEKANLLAFISVERIREEFLKTILAPNGGKGLTLLIETRAMKYILGEDCFQNAEASEMEQLSLLADNMGQTEYDLNMRLALLYLCFEKNRAIKAIQILDYSNEIKKRLQLAVNELEEFCRIQDGLTLKKFLNQFSLDSYQYLLDLAKQQCRVYDLDDTDIRSKIVLFESIRKNKEPVFMEDMAVNGDDLKTIGIQEGIDLGITLKRLLDIVHQNPQNNKKRVLLQMAGDFKKSN